MLTLQFGTTDKARNSTFVPPVAGSTVSVLLKDACSIEKPIFKLHMGDKGMANGEAIAGYNYCYCPQFRRYYYITDIVYETAAICSIECIVDVLATFRDDILDTEAFVQYAESAYNSALPDTRLPKSTISDHRTTRTNVSGLSETGCFALTLASPSTNGLTGAAQTYILTASEMSAISQKLYSKDFFDSIKNSLTNPLDSVISCKWIPLESGEASLGGASVEVCGETLGSGSRARKTVFKYVSVPVQLKYQSKITLPDGSEQWGYADYRNCEPFAEHSLWLPGVGLVSLPITPFIYTGTGSTQLTLDVKAIISPCTGAVTYLVNSSDKIIGGDPDGNVLTVSGNFGVDVPVAQRNTGYMAAISNFAQAVGSGAMGGAYAMGGNTYAGIHGAMSAGTSAINGILAMATNTTSVSGTLGGWACSGDMYNSIYAISRYYAISDEPSNCLKTIGLPLFQTRKLSEMSGLVKCHSAYVKTWATETEHQMISQYVNTNNALYGGLIIE